MPSGNRTVNTVTAAIAVHTETLRAIGYSKNVIVMHGGVAWRSLVNSNTTVPGQGDKWDLWE